MKKRVRKLKVLLALVMVLCLSVPMGVMAENSDSVTSVSTEESAAEVDAEDAETDEETEALETSGETEEAEADEEAEEAETEEATENVSDEETASADAETDGTAEEAAAEDAEEDEDAVVGVVEDDVVVSATAVAAAASDEDDSDVTVEAEDEESALVSATAVTLLNSSKALTVDGDVDESEGVTYKTIQNAIDYISNLNTTNDAEAKDGWRITVSSGSYTYFTVNQNLSNLTIIGEDGATVDCSSGSIQLMGDTITLKGLTFTATDTAWSVPVIKDASSNAGIYYDSMVTIKDCTFEGDNAGCALWICRLNANVSNCTFSGFSYAFEIINETSTAAKIDTETTTGTITIDSNTVTGCDFFIHYGVRAGIRFVVTNNIVTGSADKICSSLFAWAGDSITVSGNTFSYSAFGLQNSSDGTSAKSFLSTNTFDEHSYVVDDYYDYSTYADYSAIYYAPEIDGKTPVWSVSDYAGNLTEAFTTALSGHENDNPLTFITVGGSGDMVCMGLGYHAINLSYTTDKESDTETDTTDVDFDLSKSKEATNLDENYESDVTLSIPSADYTGELDVAFVLDGSTSHDNSNLAAAVADLLDELLEYDNLTVKVSITVFGGIKPILKTTTLTELTDENVKDLQTFLTTDYKGLSGRSGSNLQAGVEKTRALLNADTEVDGSDKYMVILTDGGARMWYDSDFNEAMSQTYLPGSTVFWNSNEDWNHRYGTTDTSGLRSFVSIWEAGQSGTVIGNYGMTYSEYKCVDSSDSRIASWDTVANGADYYTTYEAACYYAATSIVAASQEVNVCMVTYQYNPTYNYGTFTEDFKTWLETYVTRYDIATEENIDAETAAAVFSQVKDELIQMVAAGCVIVDEMGDSVDESGVDYDFDFINDIDRLTLTVGGVALSVTQIDEYTYGFGSSTGSSDGTTYPFVLTYYPDGTTYDGTAYGECFILAINVPITKNDQVQLTYSVKLTNPQTTDGTYGMYDQYGENNDGSSSYGLYTNNVARLYPVDSNGNSLTPEDFQKPTVSYEIVSLSGTKTWDDASDQDGKRPKSITVNLLADGEVVESTEVTADDDWSYSFTGLRQWDDDDEGYNPIVYSITENAVTNYSTSITYSDDGTVANITNSYTPGQTSVTVTKVWDDDNDQDDLRPDSVTVILVKNGEDTEQTVTLNEQNNWTGGFTELDEYTDGIANVYTVREIDVTGYTSAISGDASTGYVITNSHTPEEDNNTTDDTDATDDTDTDEENADTSLSASDTTDDASETISATSKTDSTDSTTSTTDTADDTSETTTAKTGDTNTVFFWIIVIAAAACVVIISVSRKKKQS